jgi:hypothetical protein
MPLDLLSPCGNQVLQRFAHFATPSGKGHAPGSWGLDGWAEPLSGGEGRGGAMLRKGEMWIRFTPEGHNKWSNKRGSTRSGDDRAFDASETMESKGSAQELRWSVVVGD